MSYYEDGIEMDNFGENYGRSYDDRGYNTENRPGRSNNVNNSSKHTQTILIVIIVLIFVAAIITFIICYVKKLWMFVPFKKPPNFGLVFYPTGNVTTLTAQEIKDRKAAITKLLPQKN